MVNVFRPETARGETLTDENGSKLILHWVMSNFIKFGAEDELMNENGLEYSNDGLVYYIVIVKC